MMLNQIVTEQPVPDIEVAGIKDDSRAVTAGDLFLAVKGESTLERAVPQIELLVNAVERRRKHVLAVLAFQVCQRLQHAGRRVLTEMRNTQIAVVILQQIRPH